MSDKPQSAADPRPNGEPFYIDSECPTCGTDLELYDQTGDIWHDEWECPDCKDGIYLDWPDSHKQEVFGERGSSEFVPLE